MNIYWLCDCGNANKYIADERFAFSSEQTSRFLGTDRCVKCDSQHIFTLNLEIKKSE